MRNNEVDVPYVGVIDDSKKYDIIATNRHEFEATQPQHQRSYVELGWAIGNHAKIFENLTDDGFRDLGYRFAEQGFIWVWDKIMQEYALIKYGRCLTRKGEN